MDHISLNAMFAQSSPSRMISKDQHRLVESVKAFVIQYLESLDVLSIQNGDEIALDEAEVVA